MKIIFYNNYNHDIHKINTDKEVSIKSYDDNHPNVKGEITYINLKEELHSREIIARFGFGKWLVYRDHYDNKTGKEFQKVRFEIDN